MGGFLIILAIIGSRTFVDYERLKREILARYRTIDLIYTGGKGTMRGQTTIRAQDGACLQAFKFAVELHIPCRLFPPRWKKVNKKWVANRDPTFLAEPDHVLAFWDGESPGTRGEITERNKLHKPIEVISVLK